MDNQQERLVWLAGFIDGEGHFGINRVKRRNHAGSGFQMTPRITITNTSKDALEYVRETLQAHGLAFYIGWKAPGKDKRTKWQWQLEIAGVKRLNRFIPVIGPYLIVKKPQAELLLKYCRHRLERMKQFQGQNCRGVGKYTEYDTKVWERIKELNQYPQRTYAEPLEGRYVPTSSES